MASGCANKNEKKKAVYHDNKGMLLSIYEKCKEESVKGLRIPIEMYEDRVLDYTESSQRMLEKMRNEKQRTRSTLDLFERAVISDSLSKMYKQLRSFTYKDIYEEVKNKVKNHELDTFCRDLRFLGYEKVNTLNYGPIVMENPVFTFERFQYLNRIKKLRAHPLNTVYYLDERIIDMSRTFKKPWDLAEEEPKTDRYIFFHIVSKNGFARGLFCNQATTEDLNRWVSEIVLTFLNPYSVIVIDKNPLHGERVSEPITRYHSKEDMLKWLQQNGIPCSASMRKAHLYELVARSPRRDPEYRLDLLFKSHGYEVLRLPENYHDLSLTELLWEHVSTCAVLKDCSGLMDLKTKVLENVKSIHREKWNQFEATIQATEQEFSAIDEATEEALIAYKIDVKESI